MAVSGRPSRAGRELLRLRRARDRRGDGPRGPRRKGGRRHQRRLRPRVEALHYRLCAVHEGRRNPGATGTSVHFVSVPPRLAVYAC